MMHDSEAAGSALQCYYCGAFAVGIVADFTFEDFDLQGDGLIYVCRCGNCGSVIEYRIREDEDEYSI